VLTLVEYKKILTMTVHSRPRYTKTVLEALSQCYGVENYRLMVSTDKDVNPEVLELVKQIDFCESEVLVYPQAVDQTKIALRTLIRAFAATDYSIYFEDDTVPARDCLRYFEFCAEVFKPDDAVWSITGYTPKLKGKYDDGRRDDSEVYALRKNAWFNPWTWATWKNRWEHMRNTWGKHPFSWDLVLNKEREILNKVEISPLLARTENIGAEGGRNCPGPEWHLKHQWNRNNFAGNGHYQLKDNPKFYLLEGPFSDTLKTSNSRSE